MSSLPPSKETSSTDSPNIFRLASLSFTLFLVLIAWAWSSLGLKIAYEARDNKVSASEASLTDIFSARYTEVKPAVVCSIFLSFGSAAMLYLKVKFGPSPFLFGTILACLTMIICLTTGYLFPYPYYVIGEAIVIPLALKAALNLVFSAVFYQRASILSSWIG